jgi:two-component system, sensor histidine kinase and response regulator
MELELDEEERFSVDGRRRKRPVLVVDDDPINQVAVAEELELGGYDADLAASGKEALEKVHAGAYRLILMDCQMPGMDGFTATQEIRKWERTHCAPRTAIVALTSHNDEGEKARALSSGMDDFIAKPFTSNDLKRIMAAFPLSEGPPSSGPTEEPDLTPGIRRSIRLIELFIQHVPGQLRDLREAQMRGVASEVRLHAHKLKGSCLALAAKPMARAAEALQRVAESGDLSRAHVLVSELERRFVIVRERLEAELTSS